jgi:ABC-type antimicrobial peptide transport system permease subunit
VYVAMSQGAAGATMRAELRTAGDPASVGPAVRAAVARVAPGAPVTMRTLSDQVRSSIRRERVLAAFASAFGAVVVVLAMLGLYGVMAYAVARRTTEIGVRQALGAGRGRVVGMVLADVGRVLAVGVLVGVPVALGAGRLLESLLFRTRPADPSVLAAAAALLGAAALLAGLVPAVRAARVPPLVALRDE